MTTVSFHLPQCLLQCQEKNFKRYYSTSSKEHKGNQQLRGVFSIIQEGGRLMTQRGEVETLLCLDVQRGCGGMWPCTQQNPRTAVRLKHKERAREQELGLRWGLIKDQFVEQVSLYSFTPQLCPSLCLLLSLSLSFSLSLSLSLTHTHTHTHTFQTCFESKEHSHHNHDGNLGKQYIVFHLD